MADHRLVPDMSTPEGIGEAIKHIETHRESDPEGTTRAVTIELLRILEEDDVADAAVLQDELKSTTKGIREVADEYTEEQGTTGNEEIHFGLKRAAGIANAVSAVTDAAVMAASGNSEMAVTILEGAEGELDGIGSSEEADAAKVAIGGIMNNMRTLLGVED